MKPPARRVMIFWDPRFVVVVRPGNEKTKRRDMSHCYCVT